MSKQRSLLGGSEQHGRKPLHPDLVRWIVACFVCGVILLGCGAARIVSYLVQHGERWQQHVRPYMPLVQQMETGLQYSAWFFAGLTVVSLLWAVFVAILWCWRLRRVRGQYLTAVIPRPLQGRAVAATAGSDASTVVWDRLIAILQTTQVRGMPPYLATELWGDHGGRVQWGIWLPGHVCPHREAIRRLMTAERPAARLVDAPDPLLASLDTGADGPEDAGARWYAGALLLLDARDYYPLPDDGLAQSSLVAALRPSRAIVASGISVIVTPASPRWARRVHLLVQRWRWISRYQSRFDERYNQEVDDISLKAQQAHACVCLRVHVIARTKADAKAECRSLVTTLTTSRKRYSGMTQSWQVRRLCVGKVHGMRLSAACRTRAPFRRLPRLMPVFPFI